MNIVVVVQADTLWNLVTLVAPWLPQEEAAHKASGEQRSKLFLNSSDIERTSTLHIVPGVSYPIVGDKSQSTWCCKRCYMMLVHGSHGFSRQVASHPPDGTSCDETDVGMTFATITRVVCRRISRTRVVRAGRAKALLGGSQTRSITY